MEINDVIKQLEDIRDKFSGPIEVCKTKTYDNGYEFGSYHKSITLIEMSHEESINDTRKVVIS